ncbi:MAG TPA: urea carboxylase-associated family protein [Burkholderiales bacterium]|nr:urea carboxylase-associated family protein [Burkholderiales bacterium]
MSKELLAREARAREVLRTHPLPGKVLREFVIPAREYAALTMKEGESLRFVDMEGKQVPDLVCFNQRDLSEELSMGNSLLINKRRELVKGNVLYSVICNPMMTITGYSNELSYAYGPMCSEEVNRVRYGVAGTRNCRDNFAMALKDWGFSARRIPDAFVPFMRVEVDERGNMEIREPTSKPGDHYDLRAEMDLVVGISNCPQERNPCNGFNPTAMGVIIYAS